MFRRFLLSLFILILPFSTPALAIAQSTTPQASPTPAITLSIKSQMQALRDQRLASKEAFQTQVQAFKDKIMAIKDERKKLIVEKIDDHVATANARLTSKMTNALDRMTELLNKIKDKGATLKAGGADTTALDAAIAAAETAISNAQTAVNTQEAKQYSANIGDDSTLRGVIGQMVSGFRLDLMGTHKLVIDAKQAVMKAMAELAKLGGVGELKKATGSATLTPTSIPTATLTPSPTP